MAGSEAPNVALNEAQIDALLLDLNARVSGPEDLRAWASDTVIAIDRLTSTTALTYVRLAQHDEHDGPIVLMLLDGEWERVI